MSSSTSSISSRGNGQSPKGRAGAAVRTAIRTGLSDLRLDPSSAIVCAVSGGPDSVALLHALTSQRPYFKFNLTAAHLNHRLRDFDSDRDETFVRQLCARLGVELVVERATRLRRGQPNLEERARELRYDFLNRVADRVGALHIALAHHRDDQAETVLLRLLRGAGARGLSAMAPCGPGRLWRPLLHIDRADVLRYLRASGAEWVTDESNSLTNILRNRVRHELLPLLEDRFVPNLRGRLGELADELRTLDQYVTAAARAELDRRYRDGRLRLADFPQLAPALAQATLREFVRQGGGGLRAVSRDHVHAMVRLCAGSKPAGRVMLPGRRQLRRDYGEAILEPARTEHQARSFNVVLDVDGTTMVDGAGFSFEAVTVAREALELNFIDGRLRSGSTSSAREAEEALFDADRLTEPLIVRNFVAGDRIAPLGMTGTRKVQDLLVDRKLPRDQRRRWPLVTMGEKVVWIPKIARSRSALVTPETRKVCRLRAVEHAPRGGV